MKGQFVILFHKDIVRPRIKFVQCVLMERTISGLIAGSPRFFNLLVLTGHPGSKHVLLVYHVVLVACPTTFQGEEES